MKLVFFGTSAFAARILSFLSSQKASIAAIVTRPDKPRGRSLQLHPPAVKKWAQEHRPDIPLYQPPKASAPEFALVLQNLNADLFLVVAFGEIIKQHLLSMPPLGCVNIHASILPFYRGAAPMQRALMDGASETGVTIISMTEEMDGGDILGVAKTTIAESMTYGELEERLVELACQLLPQVLSAIENKTVIATPQEHVQATFAPKLRSEEELIDWTRPARCIHNQVRALSPAPGAWCRVLIGGEKKRLKIKRTAVISDRSGFPGDTLAFGQEGWIVACGTEALQLIEVQLEGKALMPAPAFIRGCQKKISFIS